MDQSMAIVVLSFDGYSDLWNNFFFLFNKYWSDNKYPIYLVTNNAKPSYKGVTILNVGDEVSWSRRAREAMKMINEDYIMLMLEDYFIGEKVDSNHIKDLLEYTKSHQIDYLRIVPVPKTKYMCKESNGIHTMREDRPYGINLQAAIWKKSYFIKSLANGNYSAWEFEKRQKIESPFRVKGKCEVVDYWPLLILNGVIQGKWYRITLNYFEKQGIKINLGDRKIMSRKDTITIEIRKYLLRVIPIGIQKTLKPLLKRMGFKFVT